MEAAKMPGGPKGQKRPRDTNQLAKLMVNILTGEAEDRESYSARGAPAADHAGLICKQFGRIIRFVP